MRLQSCSNEQIKLRKGLWSPEEDEKLYNYITRYGVGCWTNISKQAGLKRCGKSCRLRWMNYLRPDLKRGKFSEQEEKLILSMHEKLGNRWSQIAARLPGRTDNEIKNYWNSCLKRKLKQSGIDPSTHLPLHEMQVNEDHKQPTSFRRVHPKFNPFPSFTEQVIAPQNLNHQCQQTSAVTKNKSDTDSDGNLSASNSLQYCDNHQVLDVYSDSSYDDSAWNYTSLAAQTSSAVNENEIFDLFFQAKYNSSDAQVQMMRYWNNEDIMMNNDSWQQTLHHHAHAASSDDFSSFLTSLSHDLSDVCCFDENQTEFTIC